MSIEALSTRSGEERRQGAFAASTIVIAGGVAGGIDLAFNLAYVLCDESYLLATWHPSTRPGSIPFNPNQKWLGLTVVDASLTGGDVAEVEFIARSRVSNAAAVRQHERSRFVLEGGKWFYIDGKFVE